MKPVNHPLHIVLALLTGGLWLIPYAVILFTQGNAQKNIRLHQQVATMQAGSDEATRLAQYKQGESYQRWLREQAEIKRKKLSGEPTGNPHSDYAAYQDWCTQRAAEIRARDGAQSPPTDPT